MVALADTSCTSYQPLVELRSADFITLRNAAFPPLHELEGESEPSPKQFVTFDDEEIELTEEESNRAIELLNDESIRPLLPLDDHGIVIVED